MSDAYAEQEISRLEAALALARETGDKRAEAEGSTTLNGGEAW